MNNGQGPTLSSLECELDVALTSIATNLKATYDAVENVSATSQRILSEQSATRKRIAGLEDTLTQFRAEQAAERAAVQKELKTLNEQLAALEVEQQRNSAVLNRIDTMLAEQRARELRGSALGNFFVQTRTSFASLADDPVVRLIFATRTLQVFERVKPEKWFEDLPSKVIVQEFTDELRRFIADASEEMKHGVAELTAAASAFAVVSNETAQAKTLLAHRNALIRVRGASALQNRQEQDEATARLGEFEQPETDASRRSRLSRAASAYAVGVILAVTGAVLLVRSRDQYSAIISGLLVLGVMLIIMGFVFQSARAISRSAVKRRLYFLRTTDADENRRTIDDLDAIKHALAECSQVLGDHGFPMKLDDSAQDSASQALDSAAATATADYRRLLDQHPRYAAIEADPLPE